jgi:hypothetical protein
MVDVIYCTAFMYTVNLSQIDTRDAPAGYQAFIDMWYPAGYSSLNFQKCLLETVTASM